MCWHLFQEATAHMVRKVSSGSSPFLITPYTDWPKCLPSKLAPIHIKPQAKQDVHQISEIAFLHKGTCVLHMKGRLFLMEPGDFCLVPADVPHYESPLQEETGYLLLWIRIIMPHVSMIFSEYKAERRDYDLSDGCIVFPGGNSHAVFTQLLEEERKNEDYKEAITRGLLLNWLGVIARQVGQMARTGGVLFNPRYNNVINAIDHFIKEHLHDPELRVSDMVQQLWLSTNYFIEHFYKMTGKTPHQYLLEKRLDTARRKLVETDESICRIAASVGFRAPHHFSRAFRRYYGVSPSAFRASVLTSK